MRLIAQNFRGLRRADLPIDERITLVAARNAAGKTSIALALQATLTRDDAPMTGAKGVDEKLLVRSGSNGATVTLDCEPGYVRVTWPQREVYTSGSDLAWASPYAVGAQDLLAVAKSNRPGVFCSQFKALPSREDLRQAVDAAGLEDLHTHKDPDTGPSGLDELWTRIEGDGWDLAYQAVKEDARNGKRAWEKVTRTGWGEKKARDWLPMEWNADLATAEADALTAAVAEARRARDAALKEIGATERRSATLQAEAAVLAARRAEVTAAEEALPALAQQRDDAADAYRVTPDPAHDLACPCCEARLSLAPGGVLVPRGEVDQPGLEDAFRAARTSWAKAVDAYGDALVRYNQAKELAAVAERAGATLAASTGDDESTKALAAAGDALRRAENRLTAHQRWSEATRLTAKIERDLALAEVLSPSGVRKNAFEQVLKLLNKELADLGQSLGVGPITLDGDLEAWAGAMHYRQLSTSEQYRVNAAMRILAASRDGSALALFDNAEVLDAFARGDLLGTLDKYGVRAVVLMTAAGPGKVPDLAQHDLGTSWWIEDAEVRPLAEATAKAA